MVEKRTEARKTSEITNRNSNQNIEHLEKNSDFGKRSWCFGTGRRCGKAIGEIPVITKGNRKKTELNRKVTSLVDASSP